MANENKSELRKGGKTNRVKWSVVKTRPLEIQSEITGADRSRETEPWCVSFQGRSSRRQNRKRLKEKGENCSLTRRPEKAP